MTDQTVVAPIATRSNVHPIVQKVAPSVIPQVLRAGFDDFMAKPSHVLFLVIIYPVVGLLLGFLSSNADLLPLFFPLVAGFALLGPVAALGLYEISRRRERGEQPTWRDAFAVTRSRSLPAIGELGLLMTAVFLAWLVAAYLIYRATMGSTEAVGMSGFVSEVLTTPQGWAMIVIGHLVGLAFAALAFALGVVSFPLLLDRHVDLGTAMRTSFEAIRVNPLTMALWALTIAVMMVAGSALALVGLALVLPILGHATWHMYRKVVAIEPHPH
jgi:uncharacterized membrane protein